MKLHDENRPIDPREGPGKDPARYESPSIRVYTEEEILAHLGPAQLYTGPLPFDF